MNTAHSENNSAGKENETKEHQEDHISTIVSVSCSTQSRPLQLNKFPDDILHSKLGKEDWEKAERQTDLVARRGNGFPLKR